MFAIYQGFSLSVATKLILAVLLLLAPQVFAKSCEEAFVLGGNAIELEVFNNHLLIEALTTVDGTVGGLFGEWDVPAGIATWAQRETLWDPLSFEKKTELLHALTKLKFAKNDFFADRRIPNLKVRSHLRFNFHEPTRFLGQDYAVGVHDIDLSSYVGQVEYASHIQNKAMRFIELHLRSNAIPAGELVSSAYTLNARLTQKPPNLHAHVVAAIPLAALEREPVKTSMNLAEYYRRANLLMEFISLLRGNQIRTQTDGDATYFDSIRPEYLVAVYRYFWRGWKEKDLIADEYKMGWVGFRGEDTYDQKGVFGFEVRGIESHTRHGLIALILNRIESGLRSSDLGFAPDLMERYNASHGGQPIDWLSSLWYRRPWRDIKKDLPPYLQKMFSNPFKRWIWFRDLIDGAGDNEGAKILLHNWADDPMFFDNKDAQERVIEAQRWALNKFLLGKQDVNELLRPFLIRSGLVSVIADSFRIDYAELMDLDEK